MQQAFALILVVAAAAGIALHGQAPAESRTFLLFIDDLHLEFRSTPHVRDLSLRLVAELTGPDDTWAIVTSGTSSISVAPTGDRTAVESAIRRITGNGLTARGFLDSRKQAEGVLELRRRADTSLSTAADAIEAVSAFRRRRPFAMLYVSNGYDAGLIEPTGLMQAASAASVSVYTIDPRGWLSPSNQQGVGQTEWNAYLDVTRGVLRAISSRTQGLPVFTSADLDRARLRLAAGGR